MDERQSRYGLRTPTSGSSSGSSRRPSRRSSSAARPSTETRRGPASHAPNPQNPTARIRARETDNLSNRAPAKVRVRRPREAGLGGDMADHGGYIAGLDGLRALAVVAVIIYHAFPGFMRGGFLGVDVFFVISGFLITTLLLREDRKNNFINLKAFWVRRARRLVPALALLVITVVPLAWAVNRDLMVGIGRQVLGALTFSTNWLELAHGSSYFDQTVPLLFKNFWSLAIEEQFYVLWPLIMLVVLALIGTWFKRVALAVGIALGSGFLMMVLYSGDNLTRLYYGTDTHIFGIALGVALAFIWADSNATVLGSEHWRRFNAGYGWGALTVVILFMLIMPDTGPWAYMGGMFVVSLLTAVFIAAMLAPNSFFSVLGETRVLRWIGTRSYGLYLWHWPILVMAAILVPTAVGSFGAFARSIVAIVVTGIIVELSFRFVETPVRVKGFRQSWEEFSSAARTTVLGKIKSGAVALLVIATVLAIALAPDKSSTQLMIEEGEQGQVATSDESAGDASHDGEAVTDEEPAVVPQELIEDFDARIPDASEVTVIGDSMIAASRTGIEYAMPGVTIIAQSTLKWSDARGIVQSAIDRGNVGRVVVLDYGTNAGVTDEQVIKDIINLLGPERMIHIVNLYSPSSFIESSNDVLASVASQYENVNLVDWNALATENPGLLQVDATHTSLDGANAFGALLKDDITQFATDLSKQLGTDPGLGWGQEAVTEGEGDGSSSDPTDEATDESDAPASDQGN